MDVASSLGKLFAPTLDKRYCLIFYVISIAQFVLIVLSIIFLLLLLADIKKNQNVIVISIVSLINLTFLYFYNRVLYTMCDRSLA